MSNFKESVKSYEQLNISISANYECNFNITGTDIYWVASSDKKNFSYRAPITVLDQEEFFIDISTVETSECPNSVASSGFMVRYARSGAWFQRMARQTF